MRIVSMTVGLPAADPAASVAWYRQVFEVSAEALVPVDGIAELPIGPAWVQFVGGAPDTPAAGVLRFGVDDVRAEHARIAGLGIGIGPLEHVPGVIDYADLLDPDGNALSIYTEPAG